MPAEATATALPPLVASLREEAKKAGVNYDFRDPGFARKVENLARQVAREYDIVLAFRAFCADPARGVTPFWFPERFDRYKRAAGKPTAPAEKQPSVLVECPECHEVYVAGRPGACPWCEEHPAGIPRLSFDEAVTQERRRLAALGQPTLDELEAAARAAARQASHV